VLGIRFQEQLADLCRRVLVDYGTGWSTIPGGRGARGQGGWNGRFTAAMAYWRCCIEWENTTKWENTTVMAKWRPIAVGAVVAVAAAALGFYWFSPAPGPQAEVAEVTDGEEDSEPGLTLQDVTLEQPDENGELLWRVRGNEVTYSPDQQVAYVTQPDSELFQDGDVIYVVTADTGEIRDNGTVIFLRGNIVARGLNNGSILRGNELEWRPEDDVLIVREEITGSHPKIRAVAQEARVYNRQNRMELVGDVVARTVVSDPNTEPWLKLQAQELIWQWDQELIQSPQPLRVEQFDYQTITDVVVGQTGQVQLDRQVVNLTGDVQMQLLEMPLNVASEALEWRVADQQVLLNQPVEMIHPEEQVNVTAAQGRMNLEDELVVLQGDVVARGQRNQAQMTSDQLTWNLEQQILLAEGNVNYRQVDPTVNLKGPRAEGELANQTIVVRGGRVVTEIVPN
jgi:LPS export ABC transporter protein LptC